MVDLSFLAEESTVGMMDKVEGKPDKPRKYLGMSEIGHACNRYLWLKFHKGCRETFTPRMRRLFDMGHYIEKRIVTDLKKAGFMVTGTQKAFKDYRGKFAGHCDGIITGLPESAKPHILEIKSSSDKNFVLFQKNGVLLHPVYGGKYYAQAQCYMGYANLDRALFIIENKNTSERYQERMKFEPAGFDTVRSKAGQIIVSPTPPKGISSRPDWYACKYCFLNHGEACRKQWEGEGAF